MSKKNKNFQITKNFSYYELTKSQTALRHGIDNTPEFEHIKNMTHWCISLGQPLRDMIGMPITVNNFFRTRELNTEIGGAENSQHMDGCSGDIEVVGMSNLDLYNIIKDHFVYDQLILEYHTVGDPDSGWVHVSFIDGDNRMQAFKIGCQ